MDDNKTVKFTVELSDREAWHFAQFLKRSSFLTYERHSDPSNPEEPQLMVNAAVKVQRSLAAVGYAPR